MAHYHMYSPVFLSSITFRNMSIVSHAQKPAAVPPQTFSLATSERTHIKEHCMYR